MPAQQSFEPDPHSARGVREFVAQVLTGEAHVEDVVLAASELATNVIRHAQTPFTVRVLREHGRTRLEVSDGSSIIPAVRELSESKRGLRLVEALAERWGAEPTDDGKTVWAEFEGA